jgi:methionyl aminopeptidase
MTMAYIDAADAPVRHAGKIKIHGPEAFEGMRKAGRLAAECLDMLVPHVVPGVLTSTLDDLAREFVLSHGAMPACLFYKGYRHTICTSINEVVCHGIPNNQRALKEGDIVNIDVTAIVDGWHGDTSRMYSVGEVKRRGMRLMDVTYECMMKGIEAIRPGLRLYELGAAIEEHALRNRYSVVEAFCGHGLGRVFHDEPNILHFKDRKADTPLVPGMIFTVEPMINLGRKSVVLMPDGWTAKTQDRSLTAQYEHSVGVTETGFEIFTLSPGGLATPHTSGLEKA